MHGIIFAASCFWILEYQLVSMSFYIIFKKRKPQHVGHTSGSYVGHIQIALWVSKSGGSTGVTHFQPWYISLHDLHYFKC